MRHDIPRNLVTKGKVCIVIMLRMVETQQHYIRLKERERRELKTNRMVETGNTVKIQINQNTLFNFTAKPQTKGKQSRSNRIF